MNDVKKEIQGIKDDAEEMVELLRKVGPDDKKEIKGIIQGYVLKSDSDKKAG